MIDLTFVIPFRNEIKHLPETLDSLANQELDDRKVEILLLDGMSSDGSREFAEKVATAHSTDDLGIRVVENAHIKTPFAFNKGIRESQGAIIGFGGAHTRYPRDYLSQAIDLLNSSDADVVGGGHNEFIPSRKGWVAEAMACLYQSPFGSGVAAYHRNKKPAYVDTVYGGFYKRSVFDRVGVFNEKLTRNQDNELNARVTGAGFKILFHPALSTAYIFKSDLKTFLKRGFMFGYYHFETWLANPRAIRLRHLAPLGLVIYLLVMVPLYSATGSPLIFLPLALYLVMLLYAALRLSFEKSPQVGILAAVLFCLYHLAYGIGTLSGIGGVIARIFRRRPPTRIEEAA